MTDTADLTAALRAHARGLHTREAAIELLIGHASWLCRTDFVDPFVHTATGLIDGTPMASIDWAAAITALNDTHTCRVPAVRAASCASPRAWPTRYPSICRTHCPAWTTTTPR